MWPRYVVLLVATGAAGVLSGILWLIPNGIMGGVLALCLSIGTIWLSQRQMAGGGELRLGTVLGAGFITGLLAGLLMAILSQKLWRSVEFGPPRLPFWYSMIMGVLYGVALHWSYYQRRFSNGSLRRVILIACGAGFVLKMLGASVMLAVTSKMEIGGELALTSALMGVLGGLPFAVMWVAITALLDPAGAVESGRDAQKAESDQ